ncbi:oncostatin M [Rhinolophus ferrumequinum]|uniref:Oncostatin M n=1 Tax=Rhinolophus ferrumequinum TaxID=59479 RepID=A0A7J7RQ66_RHIFE|nr:oncostatin-M [Rhinolophus ferrumequinum]KAF6278259.1 oncostatin M [Rhinolophus ferrumequinum]
MRAQLPRRVLLSLVLRLLFLKPVVTGSCSGDDQELLKQLQRQTDFMQDTSRLLDPYMHAQGLDVPGLKEHCQEHPGVFPRENALHGLSRRGFLQTLNAKLGHVLHRLTILQQDLPKVQEFGTVKRYIYGIRNNIYCLAQLLPGSSETAEPTQAGTEDSPPPPPASDTFQRKLQGCQFLRGYHRFMHSVGQVFHKWRESPSRSRRHSPHRALRKGAYRMQPSMRGKRLMPRGQLPQ